VLQLLFATLLHITWLLKRLPLPQFVRIGFFSAPSAGSAAIS
jgi:hypothetical protein